VTDLAPALLALYGSVEHISEEEKVNCRIHCARLLKFLWGASNAHRVTFRRISADHSTFIKFANGLMNETNAYVAQIMEKLPEVRAMQLLMADGTQWGALEQSERDEKLQRHSDNERSLRGFLPLCNETIHTVAYLSSDEEIRGPFLLPALLDRVSSMLLSVLVQLVGAKGLEIKINDPESYDFHPKQMLKEICETVVNFSSSAKFQEAVSRSGYYSTHPSVLPKALNTARKLRILSQEALDALNNLCEAAAKFKASTNAEEEDGVDIPERFVDPLLYTLMSDPVKLPMGTIMDRVTIEQHLLNDPMDPFSRQPLTVDQLVPDTVLREEIEAWKAARSSSK
jgi:ubiquitin conjugation factor E4 B